MTEMTSLDKMTLNERVKIYAEGDLENGIPPHSFDFTKEDEKSIMNALRIVWLLSREDFIHDFKRERKDIVDYCITTTSIIRIAKRFVKQCPLSTKFRLNYKKERENGA